MNQRRISSKWSRQRVWLAWIWVGIIMLSALLAPYLAHDRPIYIKQGGQTYFPIIEPQLTPSSDLTVSWYEAEHERGVWPLIPFRPDRLAYERRQPPGTVATASGSYAFQHWLGTTARGQDVLSGMIHGSRTSLKIGLLGALLTGFIGICIGGIAGYGGNHSRRWTIMQWISCAFGLPLAYFYGFEVRSLQFDKAIEAGVWYWFGECLLGVGIMLGVLWVCSFLAKLIPWGNKQTLGIPLDQILLKSIELVDALPTLLFILIIGAMFPQKSMDLILILIALTSWTGIALLVRSQVLRERGIPYVEAAYQLGIPNWRILRYHILPNVVSPIIGLWALIVGRIIIIEATLSFLALVQEDKSWGSLLQSARNHPDLWWQYLFPGLALFWTILSIQVIAENLRVRFSHETGNKELPAA